MDSFVLIMLQYFINLCFMVGMPNKAPVLDTNKHHGELCASGAFKKGSTWIST